MKRGLLLAISLSIFLVTGCSSIMEDIEGTTVSGRVTYDGIHTFPRTFVFLLSSPNDTANTSLLNGTIVEKDGRYTISWVEDGKYYLFAVADTNRDNQFDTRVDPIGWYGHRDTLTGLTVPDPIVVSGNDLTGIDIDTMYVIPSTD